LSKLNMLFIIVIFYTSSALSEFNKLGVIESLREDGYLTVIFNEVPERELYYISSDEKIIGNISYLKKIPDIYNKNRYLCKYSLLNDGFNRILRSGLDIVIINTEKEIDKKAQENTNLVSSLYKKEIISLTDKREMVLIPEGKFLMGSTGSDQDEFPEHEEFLGNYYIDKYEVSNSDYKKFADIKGVKYPDYWKNQIDRKSNFISVYFSSLPVIVSYYESAAYAAWAGKRLPSELEWEKAAKPPESSGKTGKGYLYSWGAIFRENLANTEEFWASEKNGENLKKTIIQKYGLTILEKGYLPVDMFEKDSLSYYGVAHLDGNALEWTDSWYQPYPGNNRVNKKYGTQYKVIRGGAFFLTKTDSRITDRKTGGIPDLYKDRVAGFRCVKSIAVSDKK